jgi:asparagine synthase (glutamine-hydrolysing)
MCGITGYLDLRHVRPADSADLARMNDRLIHRGPDSDGYFIDGSVALGYRRLSIIDLESGDQPMFNEDRSIAVFCNGEIFNYKELRDSLIKEGHTFRTNSDIEVLAHLYEDYGVSLLDKLNGQFAFVIYDRKRRTLFLARDQFGINPLYFTVAGESFIFASEIKAILEHPLVKREVDLTGLDQLISFPGLVSPRTMFKGIESLKSGHYIIVENGDLSVREYWDLDYPEEDEASYDKPDSYYIETLGELFARSVKYRLQADVPVGHYLSGGLDSSMVAAMIKRVSPTARRSSFSISFVEKEICEAKYQRLMAAAVGSDHHEILFDWPGIADRLTRMIYHSECPVKETFNTCSLALSEAVRKAGIKVILTGEGADELFAGYVGYRFDQSGIRASRPNDLDELIEEELRERIWGDSRIFYEVDQHPLREVKAALYSDAVNESYDEFDCLNFEVVNKDRLRGRHFIHQRSYIDFKLRLSDHLLSDHGDRMALGNSVEGRYPFLDIELVEFARTIPPGLKLNDFVEKYILRKIAEGLVPDEIINREKFGFRAPGSPYFLRQNVEWINDMISTARIKRQGYFNPATVERLRAEYSREGFKLHPHLESDLLLIVLTFNTLLDLFDLPDLN